MVRRVAPFGRPPYPEKSDNCSNGRWLSTKKETQPPVLLRFFKFCDCLLQAANLFTSLAMSTRDRIPFSSLRLYKLSRAKQTRTQYSIMRLFCNWVPHPTSMTNSVWPTGDRTAFSRPKVSIDSISHSLL